MFRDIRELPFEPGYGISSDGQAWCNIPIGSPLFVNGTVAWRPVKGRPIGLGEYLAITVNKNSKRPRVTNYYIHQLVLMMFGPHRPSPEHEVRHLDGNNKNNSIGNLAWGTKVENEEDKKRHGTTAEGVRHGRAKLDNPTVLRIRRRYKAGDTQQHIADTEGVRQSLVSRIVNRKLWDHLPEEDEAA